MGCTSEAEYLDIQLYRDREVDIQSVLNNTLPSGIKILDTKVLLGKYNSLVSVINKAEYKILLNKPFDQSYLYQKTAEFLNRENIWVDRIKKDVTQQIDIKPFIENLTVDNYSNTIFLSTFIDQGRTVRISEILSEYLLLTLQEIALTRITRIGLYVQFGKKKVTPMEI